jgi:hypothetical protein
VSAGQDGGALTELPAFPVEKRSLTDILQSRLILPAVHIEAMNPPICVSVTFVGEITPFVRTL